MALGGPLHMKLWLEQVMPTAVPDLLDCSESLQPVNQDAMFLSTW